MNKQEILNLAKLARLEISDDEAESYQKDFNGILNYVDMIAEVDVPMKDYYKTNLAENYMRNDNDMYEAGSFTADILGEAPDSKDGYFKVKKVL